MDLETEILQKFMGAVKVTTNEAVIPFASDNLRDNVTSDISNNVTSDISDNVTSDISDNVTTIDENNENDIVAPELSLNTMTLVNSLDRKFNLDILNKYVKLSKNFYPVKPGTSPDAIKKNHQIQEQGIEQEQEPEPEQEDLGQEPGKEQKPKGKNKGKNKGKGKGKEKGKGEGKETEGEREQTDKAGNFNNQKTFYHRTQLQNGEIVSNLKLFSNGQLVLTGCRETQYQPHKALEDLIDVLRCEGETTITVPDANRNNLTKYLKKDGNGWARGIAKMIPVYNILASKINKYLNLDLPLNLATIDFSNINSKLESDILFLFTVYKILLIYYDENDIKASIQNLEAVKASQRNKIATNFSELFQEICDKWDGTQFKLYLPSYIELSPIRYSRDALKIALINMGVKLKINLDRALISKIINDKYNTPARFDPDIYQGVQISYTATTDCFLHNPKEACLPDEKFPTAPKPQNQCYCNLVSIFIFRVGDIIITGSKSWKQTKSAYDFIMKFINAEKDKIITHYDLQTPEKKTKLSPALKCGEFIFINKGYLISKPRNYLVIKKMSLDHVRIQP